MLRKNYIKGIYKDILLIMRGGNPDMCKFRLFYDFDLNAIPFLTFLIYVSNALNAGSTRP